MKTQNLKPEVVQMVRNNDEALYNIAKTMNRAIGTVKNWFYRNDSMLYAPPVLQLISHFSDTDLEDLMEDSKEESLTK